MKSGLIISGLVHVLLLILTLFRLPWSADPIENIVVTDVSVISETQFDAARSDAPDIAFADVAPMQSLETEANDAVRPDDAIAPTETIIDVTEDPTERDTDANLDALLVPLTNPEVAVVEPQIFSPEISTESSPTFGSGIDGDSQVTSLTPSQPRSAALVSQEAAVGLPSIDATSDRNIEETTSDINATEPTPEEDPQSVEDSVTEIEPEAKPFPELSGAPPQRSNRIPAIQQEIETAEAEAEAAAAEAAQAAEEPVDEPEVETPTENTDAIDDLFSQIDDVAVETPSIQPRLSGAQQQSIGAAIGPNWNLTRIYGIENYEQFVIRVSVLINADGEVIGPVKPVEPSNPTGSYQLAFEIARVAIERTGTIPIPAGTLAGDTNLILRFDPANGVGF